MSERPSFGDVEAQVITLLVERKIRAGLPRARGCGRPDRGSVFPGLGHDYPAPFEAHLADAVSFVLDGTSSISP